MSDNLWGEIKRIQKEIEKLKLFDIPKKSDLGGGGGDTTSPDTNTDNAIARWDGVDSKTLQNSLATLDDAGSINIPSGQTYNINGSPHTHAVTSFNVKDYGATGDGATDDTDAIQDAIDALDAAGGGVLYFPFGTYKTSGGFTLANPFILRGDGKAGFDGSTGAGSTVVSTSATNSLFTATAYSGRFKDIALVNDAAGTPSAGAGITVAGLTLVYRVDFENVSVKGFWINIAVQVSCSWTMESCWLTAMVKYGLLVQNTENAEAGDWAIIDSGCYSAAYDADAAIRIESGGGGKIVNLKINEALDDKHFTYGIDVQPAGNMTVLLVTNSSIEGMTGNGINVVANGFTIKNLIFQGNEIAHFGNTGYAISMEANTLGEISEVVIDNNVLMTSGTARPAISLTKVNNAFVGPGIIEGFTSLISQSGCTNIVFGSTSEGSTPGGLVDPTTTVGDMIYRAATPVNFALVSSGASATAISTNGGYVPDNAIDGEDSTFWAGDSLNVPSPWIKIDLGASRTFNTVLLKQNPDAPYTATVVKIETSTDDSAWDDQGIYSISGETETFLLSSSVTARYVRLTGNLASDGWIVYTIEIYNDASVTRLPIGSEGDILTTKSGIPDWEAQSTLKLNDFGVPDGAVAMNSQQITGMADPTLDQDAATKKYVDDNSTGGTPGDTVSDETTWDIAPSAGVATEYSRADHTHGTPEQPAGTGDVLGPASSTDGHLAVWDGTDSKTLKDGGAVPAGASTDGWVAAGETWTYEAADDPTYTFSEPIDATTKYSPGMKIKCTQGGSVKYGIITAVGAYSGGKTIITAYWGTDYNLGATITNPYYSTARAPTGFPLDPAKWTVSVANSSDYTQASPVSGTWYNLGSISISVPIGAWIPHARAFIYNSRASAGNFSGWLCLSTANNSASDSKLISVWAMYGTIFGFYMEIQGDGSCIVVASKTVYYLNEKVSDAGMTSINLYGAAVTPTYIDLVCAYL